MRFQGEPKNGFVISDHTDSSLPNKRKIRKRIIYHDNGMSSYSSWEKKNNNNKLILTAKTRRKSNMSCKWIYMRIFRFETQTFLELNTLARIIKLWEFKTEADELFFFFNYLENKPAKADITYVPKTWEVTVLKKSINNLNRWQTCMEWYVTSCSKLIRPYYIGSVRMSYMHGFDCLHGTRISTYDHSRVDGRYQGA